MFMPTCTYWCIHIGMCRLSIQFRNIKVTVNDRLDRLSTVYFDHLTIVCSCVALLSKPARRQMQHHLYWQP